MVVGLPFPGDRGLEVAMLRRIDMVAIYVADWPAAVAWYEEKLGLTPVYVEHDHQFAVLGLPDGGPVLHLVGDRRPVGGRSRCAPNIAVDDFNPALVELKNRGVDVLSVQDEQDEGYRLATIADPEGNEINLYVTA
jgi:catechol 2,3-dioxygenase-like lactoylglutathione lyase family enzyme